MIKSNRGQLSIFMGITLIVVMSMLAFVVNVGLFVKAKINLQNATDAAAFAGAATQARQLTNIAYANWELRNTYKEWMFKYYILGQLGFLPNNFNNTNLAKPNVSFRLINPPVAGFTTFDQYNIPSICIHNNSVHNICPIFALPGIPRFESVGAAGIADIAEAFASKLSEEKAKDCSRRSKANFLTALTWAYGSGIGDTPEAPLVATNRPGAWVQALELALRIRNLEMIVNRPPVADITRSNINQFQGKGSDIGLNERPIKAFWSAYRNLSGGVYKDKLDGSDELSARFKLTELSPQAYQADPNSVSGFLIPDTFSYSDGGKALQKHYLDLQLMPVNFVTMFSTFVSTSGVNATLGDPTVSSDATCGVSKSALPVPGYILGFTKNPEVLTYYAVKAESKFIGLFFPGGNGSSGIKLTAYAAAKPFGGRIGPKLFGFTAGNHALEGRNDKDFRSNSYVTGLSIPANAKFKPGMPIPTSRQEFWVNEINKTIGGVPGEGGEAFFGIPNMIYDFDTENDLKNQVQKKDHVQVVTQLPADNFPTSESLGLYNSFQLKSLKNSLGNVTPGTNMSGAEVMAAIIRARRPTKYDAINYLVPDFREMSDGNNAAPVVKRLSAVGNSGYTYQIFAPLLGPDLLYKTANEMGILVKNYMDKNSKAIDAYLQALLDVGTSIYNESHGGTSKSDTTDAARSIHINAGTGGSAVPALLIDAPATDPGCKNDMASRFNHFFRAEKKGCDIIPLEVQMTSYIDKQATDNNLFYIGYYYHEASSPLITELKPEQLMTAYFPGERQGTRSGDNKGIADHPLGISSSDTTSYSTRRNYYSTKFFQMAKVMDSPPMPTNSTNGRSDYHGEPALKEGSMGRGADLENVQIQNPLKYDAATGIDNKYFLDF